MCQEGSGGRGSCQGTSLTPALLLRYSLPMSDILLITEPTSAKTIQELALKSFGEFVKGVVDIEKGIMALGAEMHADEEAFLLERGSEQKNLWGINLYPEATTEEWLEFDSMINIRPSQGNRSRGVEDPAIQEKIRNVISRLVTDS